MKHLLILAMLALAATVWGETNATYVISNGCYTAMKVGWYQIGTNANAAIEYLSNNIPVACASNSYSTVSATDEGIRKLAAEGRICEVFGHCWERLTPETQSRIALYQNGREVVPCKCRICGKEETRTGDYK